MELTILGNGPACPNKGGATSGYLITHGDTSLLIECGTGVVSKLQEHLDYHQLIAIVISHMHADHFLDLVPYRYGLKYAPYARPWQPPLLFLPPGGLDMLRRVVEPFSEHPDFFDGAFRVAEYDPSAGLIIDGIILRFARTPHPMPAFAMAIEADGRTLVFSSDSGPSADLEHIARGAHIMLAEAAIARRDQDPDGKVHLTAADAGAIAARAGVQRLLLTHFWQEFDRHQILREASDAFGAPVDLAEEGKTYPI